MLLDRLAHHPKAEDTVGKQNRTEFMKFRCTPFPGNSIDFFNRTFAGRQLVSMT